MSTVSPELLSSPAFQLVQSQGWDWKPGTSPNIELDTCPYCSKSGGGHFYMEVHGAESGTPQRDGLHTCHRCGKGGNLYALKQKLNLIVSGTDSRKDWGGGKKKIEPLPDTEALHQALLEDEDAMDYLMNGRGFSREIIQRQKLGLIEKRFFKGVGEVRGLVYPYLVNGNTVWVHYRTLPTMPLEKNRVGKQFSSPTGWEAPLYNGEILREGLKELVMVEGEANCIAAMDHGVEYIVGVPGANFKKAEWIVTLDTLELDKIYVCYDNDSVGQKAGRELAQRVGVERCWRIALPDFTVTTDEGETRKGKDLNEWFVAGGGTAEAFETLKEEAIQFDVNGVSSSKDAVQEFFEELMGNGSIEPKFRFRWKTLNKYLGIDPGDVIDILAPEKIGKTTFGLNIMEDLVQAYEGVGVIICLEMTRARLARKWISYTSGIADNIPQTPEEAQLLKAQFLDAIPKLQDMAANRTGDLYFCLPTYETDEDLYTLIRDCVRRYGADWVLIDNLQRWVDTTVRGRRNRTEHLSEISKGTSKIAKELDTVVFRVLQPHRIKEGQIVSTDNTDGSSQIAKDCDATITLHRNKMGGITQAEFDACAFVEHEEVFSDKMLVTVGLSRYSGGGATTLHYDGARSRVSEYDEGYVSRVKAEASKNVGYEATLSALGLTAPAPQVPPAAAAVPAEHPTETEEKLITI